MASSIQNKLFNSNFLSVSVRLPTWLVEMRYMVCSCTRTNNIQIKTCACYNSYRKNNCADRK